MMPDCSVVALLLCLTLGIQAEWTELNGIWYYFSETNEKVTYYEAIEKCESRNSHLVVVTEGNQNNYIKTQNLANGGLQRWVGLSNTKTNHDDNACNNYTLFWNSDKYCDLDTSVFSFEVASDKCNAITLHYGSWHKQNCNFKAGYICQWVCDRFYLYLDNLPQYSGLYRYDHYFNRNIKYTKENTNHLINIIKSDNSWEISNTMDDNFQVAASNKINSSVPYGKSMIWKTTKDRDNSVILSGIFCVDSSSFSVCLYRKQTDPVCFDLDKSNDPQTIPAYTNEDRTASLVHTNDSKYCICFPKCQNNCGYIFPYPKETTNITLDNGVVAVFTSLNTPTSTIQTTIKNSITTDKSMGNTVENVIPTTHILTSDNDVTTAMVNDMSTNNSPSSDTKEYISVTLPGENITTPERSPQKKTAKENTVIGIVITIVLLIIAIVVTGVVILYFTKRNGFTCTGNSFCLFQSRRPPQERITITPSTSHRNTAASSVRYSNIYSEVKYPNARGTLPPLFPRTSNSQTPYSYVTLNQGNRIIDTSNSLSQEDSLPADYSLEQDNIVRQNHSLRENGNLIQSDILVEEEEVTLNDPHTLRQNGNLNNILTEEEAVRQNDLLIKDSSSVNDNSFQQADSLHQEEPLQQGDSLERVDTVSQGDPSLEKDTSQQDISDSTAPVELNHSNKEYSNAQASRMSDRTHDTTDYINAGVSGIHDNTDSEDSQTEEMEKSPDSTNIATSSVYEASVERSLVPDYTYIDTQHHNSKTGNIDRDYVDTEVQNVSDKDVHSLCDKESADLQLHENELYEPPNKNAIKSRGHDGGAEPHLQSKQLHGNELYEPPNKNKMKSRGHDGGAEPQLQSITEHEPHIDASDTGENKILNDDKRVGIIKLHDSEDHGVENEISMTLRVKHKPNRDCQSALL